MKHKTNLTLEEATREWLRQVAESRGVSQSAIVDELVDIASGALAGNAVRPTPHVLGPSERYPGCMG